MPGDTCGWEFPLFFSFLQGCCFSVKCTLALFLTLLFLTVLLASVSPFVKWDMVEDNRDVSVRFHLQVQWQVPLGKEATSHTRNIFPMGDQGSKVPSPGVGVGRLIQVSRRMTGPKKSS